MVYQQFHLTFFSIITVVTLMSFVTQESCGSLLMKLEIYLCFLTLMVLSLLFPSISVFSNV